MRSLVEYITEAKKLSPELQEIIDNFEALKFDNDEFEVNISSSGKSATFRLECRREFGDNVIVLSTSAEFGRFGLVYNGVRISILRKCDRKDANHYDRHGDFRRFYEGGLSKIVKNWKPEFKHKRTKSAWIVDSSDYETFLKLFQEVPSIADQLVKDAKSSKFDKVMDQRWKEFDDQKAELYKPGADFDWRFWIVNTYDVNVLEDVQKSFSKTLLKLYN